MNFFKRNFFNTLSFIIISKKKKQATSLHIKYRKIFDPQEMTGQGQ